MIGSFLIDFILLLQQNLPTGKNSDSEPGLDSLTEPADAQKEWLVSVSR